MYTYVGFFLKRLKNSSTIFFFPFSFYFWSKDHYELEIIVLFVPNTLKDIVELSHSDESYAGPYFRLNLRESHLILVRSFCENQLILNWKTLLNFKLTVHKIC